MAAPQRPQQPSGDAATEAWREVLKAEAALEKAEARVKAAEGRLRRHRRLELLLALMAGDAPESELGEGLLEALGEAVGAARGGLWRLGRESFEPMAFRSVERVRKAPGFPAPHPFRGAGRGPQGPGWLPVEGAPPALKALVAGPDEGLWFVPFEHQLLLVGFAVLPRLLKGEITAEGREELETIQRLAGMAFHHRWVIGDLADKAESSRKYAEALEQSRWAVTEGDWVRLEFLRFASGALGQGLSELLVLLKLGLDGAYSEEEVGNAFMDAFRIGRHLRDLVVEVSRCTETAERTLSLSPVDPGPVLRAVKESMDRGPSALGDEEAPLIWPSVWTALPKVMGDAHVLSEVASALVGLVAFHARGAQEALRLELGATRLRLRFPLPHLDLRPVVAGLDDPRAPHSAVVGGPALALVVSRQLVRDMGGELRVEPEGAGSAVCVDLVLAEA